MAQKIKYTSRTTKMLADTYTPVSVYLKLRDVYPNAILLESTDYRAANNSFSYICLDPLTSIIWSNQEISISNQQHQKKKHKVGEAKDVFDLFEDFRNAFLEQEGMQSIANGLFGYMSFDAVNVFDKLNYKSERENEIPLMHFSFYRFVIAFDHFRDELVVYENIPEGDFSRKERLQSLLQNKNVSQLPFMIKGKEHSNISDDAFVKMVEKGVKHCYRGDVFQVVLSRRFTRKFTGDDMNLYRCLRSINPSPYLFYFDYSSYRIFGSSPEAQLVVKKGVAKINPIAGTFRRTGDDEADRELAAKLAADEKENAEHVMLVDLARNDLSKHAREVTVEHYKQVHFYSHVIHLVSEVTGNLSSSYNPLALIADSFPAGTLSGAPKHRALQLIHDYENQERSFYGGCIGFIGFNGDINTAITIRSFMSKNNTLHYQAGAGVVAASNPQSELEEVNNKLRALRSAIEMAEQFRL
ncbi:MAG: anthranilate synthase component I family protein [Bacteroidetes bacterium]|nr:anthranilate synthase component I family protein [Bacteroidota bacterium]